MTTDAVTADAQSLNRVLTRLARRYHLRDRDDICCHGITASQCYALQALAEGEPLTMGELAATLGLQLSTVTRTIDPLVERALVARNTDPADRRCCRVEATPEGVRLVETIVSELVERERALLAGFDPHEREVLIRGMERLVDMIDATTPASRCC